MHSHTRLQCLLALWWVCVLLHVFTHITICWNCPFIRLFMWGCACLWNEMFLCDALRKLWVKTIFFLLAACNLKDNKSKKWDGNGGRGSQSAEREREMPICIRCVRNNLQIMLHLISCCFGCRFRVWVQVCAKTHSHAFHKLLLPANGSSERVVEIVKGWDWMGFCLRTQTQTQPIWHSTGFNHHSDCCLPRTYKRKLIWLTDTLYNKI